MKYTTENMDKLIEWLNEGSKTVRIEIKNYSGELEHRIWCYDYDLSEGQSIKEISELPTTEVLRKKKIERLERDLAAEKKEVAV